MTTICKKRGAPRQSLANRIGRRRLRESGELYLIMLPVLVMIFIFFYMPMFGVVIAFQDYVPGDPFFAFDGSTKWVGLQHFKTFFSSIYFPRLLKNTLTLSLMNLAFGFWVPIAFALLLNEVTHLRYKKLVQTASYMPYFISMVVAAGMVVSFIEKDGLVNQIITLLGGDPVSFRTDPEMVPCCIHGHEHLEELRVEQHPLSLRHGLHRPGALRIGAAGRREPLAAGTAHHAADDRPHNRHHAHLRGGRHHELQHRPDPAFVQQRHHEDRRRVRHLRLPRGSAHGQDQLGTAIGLFASTVNLILVFIANKCSNKISGDGLF